MSALVRQRELNFTPGTNFDYTTSNYVVLELIIERATGTPLGEFADANIFAPLGMESTQIHRDVPLGAIGYSSGPENEFLPAGMLNRQGMYTTVEDFLLWEQNFYEDKLGRNDFARRLVTPGSLNGGKELDYAYGLDIGEYKGLRTVAHPGGFKGFNAATLRFPDQEFSVVCFCNVGARALVLASQVADLYLGDEFTVGAAESVDVSEDDLKDLTGTYMNSSGRVFTVALKDGVFGFVGPRGTNRLVPLGNARFRGTRFGNNEAQFYRENPDSPWRFEIIIQMAGMRATPGLTFNAVRLESPSPSQLEEYVGEYVSDEIPTTYSVVMEGADLALVVGEGTRKLPLKPTIMDGLRVEGGSSTIEFVRDERSRVVGFGLQASGVWNVHFVRRD